MAGTSQEHSREILSLMLSKTHAKSGTVPIGWKTLTREEEGSLGGRIQELVRVRKVREELKAEGDGIHSDLGEWARRAGLGGEAELLEAVERGHAARQFLLSQNLRLITKLAYKYLPYCQLLTLEDLCAAGLEGLTYAVDTFDPSYKLKFSTHGYQNVRWAMSNLMYEFDPDVRVPKRWRSKLMQIYRVQRELQGKGQAVNANTIASELEIQPSQVLAIKRLSWPVRLDKKLREGDEGSTETLGDLQTFEDTFNDEVHKEDMQLEGMLHQLLTTLQPHEAEVLRLRYGLDNGKVKSQQEVSNFLQIHPHTVKRYEHSALQKMRHPARAYRLHPYVGKESPE